MKSIIPYIGLNFPALFHSQEVELIVVESENNDFFVHIHTLLHVAAETYS